MSAPFIYIATNKIKEGKVEEARKMVNHVTQLVEANEPRCIAFNMYFDEANLTFVCVQVHPDAASMDTHMEVIAEHLTTAYDVIEETVTEQLYGPGSDRLAEEFRQWSPDGVFAVIPNHEVGFTRSSAQA